MAVGNNSGDGNHKTFLQMYCSQAPTGETHHLLTAFSVLNVFLSITAFLGNTLILIALHKLVSSLHPPSKLLLHCLATTDLFVGLISQPLFIIYLMSVVNEHWEICLYAFTLAFIAGYLLGSVSFLTLTVISVDRLLALLLGLRYRHVVTLKRGDCSCSLGRVHSRYNHVLLELFHNIIVQLYSCTSLPCDLDGFLLKDFLYAL